MNRIALWVYCFFVSLIIAATGSSHIDISQGLILSTDLTSFIFSRSFLVEGALLYSVWLNERNRNKSYRILIVIAFIASMNTLSLNQWQSYLDGQSAAVTSQVIDIERQLNQLSTLIAKQTAFGHITKAAESLKRFDQLSVNKAALLTAPGAVNGFNLFALIDRIQLFLFLQIINVLAVKRLLTVSPAVVKSSASHPAGQINQDLVERAVQIIKGKHKSGISHAALAAFYKTNRNTIQRLIYDQRISAKQFHIVDAILKT